VLADLAMDIGNPDHARFRALEIGARSVRSWDTDASGESPLVALEDVLTSDIWLSAPERRRLATRFALT
jgi:hypothetical protein